jgi:hypothetical protein
VRPSAERRAWAGSFRADRAQGVAPPTTIVALYDAIY